MFVSMRHSSTGANGPHSLQQLRSWHDSLQPYLATCHPAAGEEILHSARLWTHGYDLYGPDMNLVSTGSLSSPWLVSLQ